MRFVRGRGVRWGVLAVLVGSVSALMGVGLGAPLAAAAGESGGYSGLSDSEALAVADEFHGGTLGAPVVRGVPLEPGWRVESYLGDFTARVVDGETGLAGLVESSVPLRAPGVDGALAPVDLELVERGGVLVPRVPLVPVELDRDPRGGVSFGDAGFSFSPVGFGAAAPELVAGRAAWANAARDLDYFVRATAGGVETFAQLRSADSPESLSWRFDLPRGAELRLAGRGGAVIERGGEALARISPPIAWDAGGGDVEASYELAGEVLTMVVEHRRAGVSYPVLADPELTDSDLDANTGGWQSSSTSGPWEFPTPGVLLPGGNWTFVSGDYGQWAYTAPGSAYVYNAHFIDVAHDSDGSAMVQGIARPDGQSWEAGFWNKNGTQASGLIPMVETTDSSGNRYQHCTDGFCRPGSGASGNKAIFRGLITSPGYRPQHSFYQAFNSTLVYLDDRDVPVLGLPTHGGSPGAWVDSASYTVSGTVSDGTSVVPGLGAKKLRLLVPRTGGGNDEVSASHGCAGGHNDRCPQQWTGGPLSYETADMPEGINTLRLHGQDVLGKESAPQTWQVKVDRSGPQQQITGDGWTDVAGIIPPGERTINATANDPYSGVKSIEIKIDGVRKHYVTQSCPSGSCSMSTTYRYDSGDYPPEEHTIEVISTDQVGNQTTDSKTVTFGTGIEAPEFSCDSSGATTVSSGHIGGAANYLGVKAETVGDRTAVCWHLATGALANQAGGITFTGATLGGGGPELDPGGASACVDSGGAAVVDRDGIGGRLTISYYTAAGEAWVCVYSSAGLNYRLILEVPDATTPDAQVGVASAPLAVPPPKPWPAKASSACTATTGTFLLNMQVASHHVWLATRSGGTSADVCVRHQEGSGAGRGGIATVNPASAPAEVGVGQHDLAICNEQVDHTDNPVRLHIDKSTTTNPQSVCVDAGVVKTRAYVGSSGGDPVTFTPDNG